MLIFLVAHYDLRRVIGIISYYEIPSFIIKHNDFNLLLVCDWSFFACDTYREQYPIHAILEELRLDSLRLLNALRNCGMKRRPVTHWLLGRDRGNRM